MVPVLLHIDSSPNKVSSVSRALTGAFVEGWLADHPDGRVVVRDLSENSIAPVDAAWIGAAFTPPQARTDAQAERLQQSDKLIDELVGADELVVGLPMHNFAPPAALKLWIDQIVRVGKTYAYQNGVRAGILTDRPVTFCVASGGTYEPGTASAGLDFVEPYLKAIFGYVGLFQTRFVTAPGTGAFLRSPEGRPAFVEHHRNAARRVARLPVEKVLG